MANSVQAQPASAPAVPVTILANTARHPASRIGMDFTQIVGQGHAMAARELSEAQQMANFERRSTEVHQKRLQKIVVASMKTFPSLAQQLVNRAMSLQMCVNPDEDNREIAAVHALPASLQRASQQARRNNPRAAPGASSGPIQMVMNLERDLVIPENDIPDRWKKTDCITITYFQNDCLPKLESGSMSAPNTRRARGILLLCFFADLIPCVKCPRSL
jgi:hypothetical protein